MSVLDNISLPEDIRDMDYDQLHDLCDELRQFLIDNVSKTGGHLSSNLGVVELTVAIHRVYDTARDRLVFDVGHQSYVHKVLTGRKDRFDTLRQLGGVSGFPKPCESDNDAFIAGHASNSISVALGMARVRTMKNDDYDVVALIGDGALTGGLSFEGLCDAGPSGEPLVVILNDNGMSINRNVGGISKLLSEMRVKPSYINFKRSYRRVVGRVKPLYIFTHKIKEWLKGILLHSNIFDEMGLYYIGPVDGHDIHNVETVLRWAREMRRPVLVHVITQKGKGYLPAETYPDRYHGVCPFDPEIGDISEEQESFSSVFGEALSEMAANDDRIVAVTAAMGDATGLADFSRKFPDRFFDVGIAEGHAVSMCAGMAKQGAVPVFAVYSSFLQRGYDMLIHDAAILKQHVVFGVDRAGLVGQDGETHQGVFDVAYLASVPHMAVFCPSSFAEVRDMLQLAIRRVSCPVVIRYPKGPEGEFTGSAAPEPTVKMIGGRDVTLVGYGTMINEIIGAARLLRKQGVSAEIIKLNLINPLDTAPIFESIVRTRKLVVPEEACDNGCVGRRLLAAAAEKGYAPEKTAIINLGDGIVVHGSVAELRKMYSLDADGICKKTLELMHPSGAGQ